MLLRLFYWLLFLVFGIFLTRSIDLMLIKGGYFKKLADNNRIRKIRTIPARGRILDRFGQEIAINNIKYMDEQGNEIDRHQALENKAQDQILEQNWVREYPMAEAAAHITGYLGEVNQDEITNTDDFYPGDIVGRGGLEQFYDQFLRGTVGEELVEVNPQGEVIRQLAEKEPIPGRDLSLTLDKKWQESSFAALKKQAQKGAVVVLEPDTGAILALASWPSFDPNLFTKNPDLNKINQLLGDKNLPFLNRAIGGAYHPGSTFKMIVAIAGLEEGKIDENKKVEDTGIIQIGQWSYGNWYYLDYGQTEGMVDVVKAIQRSNDIFFYKVGEWTGINRLLAWSKKFGFGQKTGIDLPAEVSGFLPSPEWKKQTKGESWFLGNTYHLSIGQGDLTASPLQVAVATAAIANGGFLCQPHLAGGKNCQNLKIDSKNINLVRQGMIAACQAGGTGFPFFNFDPQVACKTGTAQVGGDNDPHAWLTLYYPVDQPKVVMTILLENGGSGAYDAAPLAKEVIERYYEIYKPEKEN